MLAQRPRGAEARAGRDALDRVVRRFQQPLGQCEALVLDPLSDGRARGFAKASREGAPAHQRAPGKAVESVGLVEVPAEPLQQRREAIAFGSDHHGQNDHGAIDGKTAYI
jgi:hypothetical protein